MTRPAGAVTRVSGEISTPAVVVLNENIVTLSDSFTGVPDIHDESLLFRANNVDATVESNEPFVHIGLDPNVRTRPKFAELCGAAGGRQSSGLRSPAAIPPLTTGTAGSQTFRTHDATTEAGEPLHCGTIANATHWISIPVATNGTLQLSVTNLLGRELVFQYTTNIGGTIQWLDIDTNSSATTSHLFSDNGASNSTSRFYRIKEIVP
ncbi:MAG: hypothetical protein CMO80_16710 [Verrucomicrobiales bacterium]|nr:hypothetical protein [Verrucomicrobiales bacterium]